MMGESERMDPRLRIDRSLDPVLVMNAWTTAFLGVLASLTVMGESLFATRTGDAAAKAEKKARPRETKEAETMLS